MREQDARQAEGAEPHLAPDEQPRPLTRPAEKERHLPAAAGHQRPAASRHRWRAAAHYPPSPFREQDRAGTGHPAPHYRVAQAYRAAYLAIDRVLPEDGRPVSLPLPPQVLYP